MSCNLFCIICHSFHIDFQIREQIALPTSLLCKYSLPLIFDCFYRDLKGWIHTMTILVTNDELAKDVVGAEALLDRHRVRSFPWMMNLFYEECNGIIFLITHHAA